MNDLWASGLILLQLKQVSFGQENDVEFANGSDFDGDKGDFDVEIEGISVLVLLLLI